MLNMKRMISVVLAAGMILTSGITALGARDTVYYAKDADYVNGVSINASGTATGFYAGANIGFKEVFFTQNMKSVVLETYSSAGNHADADVMQLRLDDPKGKLIGYVNVEGGATSQRGTYRGAIDVPTEGTHDLYLVSSFARFDAVEVISLALSEDPYVEEVYVPTDESKLVDNYHDTWVAHNETGRALADYAEVGPYNPEKQVGIFYWTWHASFSSRPTFNNSELMAEHPEARLDYTHSDWPTDPNTAYFWNEPLWGFYDGADYWVLRKQVQMLANAGVDALFFDCTNGPFAWRAGFEALCEAMHDAREEGLDTPQIVFISNFGPADSTKELLKSIYLTMYKDGKYSDLWYQWDGKPLVLAYPQSLVATEGDAEDAALMEEIKNFFTFRLPQPAYTTGPSNNQQWGWLEAYPQHAYGVQADGTVEQAVVGTSVNHSYVTNAITAMNNTYVMGRSYTDAFGQDMAADAHLYGYHFDEQWETARNMEPELVFVTGWNEWTAGRNENWGSTPNGFPDQFDDNGSRDCEPTKGVLKDNYYYILVDNIRKYKGVRPTPVATAEKTIDINGGTDQWADVGPSFINDKGTYNRDADGYGDYHYTNYTARNNVILSKVSRDAENLYFMAQTAEAITTEKDKDWMNLYINADSNYATGWYGYDFVINRTTGVLEKNDGGFTWSKVADVAYTVNGNTLQIQVPKAALGIAAPVCFAFKWVDNSLTTGDIMDFWVNGNAAPCGRFNYLYTETAPRALSEDLRIELNGTNVVRAGSNDAIVSGKVLKVYEKDTRYTAVAMNGTVYFPANLLKEVYNAKVEYEADKEQLTIKTVDRTVRVRANAADARIDGRLKWISTYVQLVDGVPYVPATLMQDCFGETVTMIDENTAAFGADFAQTYMNQAISAIYE